MDEIRSAIDVTAPTAQVGIRLREARASRGWSLDRAAQETGVSKAMLGQIERGESSPTVATLWKIAGGFRCSLTRFLVPEAAPEDTLFRSVTAERARPASDEMLVAPLFPFEARFGFEWMELTLLPGYERLSDPHAPGVTEHVLVISGQIEVLVDGQWHPLAEGEAVRFAADRPHGYRNTGALAAVCHDLIHYPA
jgi:transcriptional regulator with XRE-family HTH domain